MRVLKFGGTSVGSAARILEVIDILKDYKSQNIIFCSVFSAVGGMTNKLIEMSTLAANQDDNYKSVLKEFEAIHLEIVRNIIDVKNQSQVIAAVKTMLNDLEDILQGVYLVRELSNKSLDFIVSHGERMSTYMTTKAAEERGLAVEMIDSRELVRTNSDFGKAKVDFAVTNKLIVERFKVNPTKFKLITGFIGSDSEGNTTTLGRGGSDYSASIFAAALDAELTEIWTDVNGVMTADPRKVQNAYTLEKITYNEAMEMSHFGAKVIYPPTLQPVFAKKIPIAIKNTFNPSFPGTLISEQSGEVHKLRVKGISSIDDISLVTVQGSGMIGVSGFSARLFSVLGAKGINIILITQASSEHSITFGVAPGQGLLAKDFIETEFEMEMQAGKLEPVRIVKELSIVAIVGENMQDTPGISGRMFSALGKNGINISAIAQGSSELNISAVIPKKNIAKALNVLHDAFFKNVSHTLNVFVVGPGLIGSTLLNQIGEQQAYLLEKLGLELRVVGIANSKNMVFEEKGLDLSKWNELLAKGESSSIESFVAKIKALNLPNSVFVDNTSNKHIPTLYPQILDSSVSIVTPNKVANSSSLVDYKILRQTAQKRGVLFLYETNVGAGLPVINTLQDLIHSGDEIVKIEGVLSGSLSFIFNTFDGSTSFKDVVMQAKEKGYTEPDPRDDLNGMDVARKILILSREAGYELEPSDVKIENILPQACIDAKTVDSFFEELTKADDVFKKMILDAKAANQKLRFIACMENGKTTVGLKAVDANHPFYSMSGSDNMISYTTRRYLNNPLVIKGPGAGAEVTAAGVFADIIRVSNYLS